MVKEAWLVKLSSFFLRLHRYAQHCVDFVPHLIIVKKYLVWVGIRLMQDFVLHNEERSSVVYLGFQSSIESAVDYGVYS